MTETQFNSALGSFALYRLPRRKREQLRAWDAADEYLLKVLAEAGALPRHPLLCNDQFGALAVSLHQQQPLSWSDSWLAHRACEHNLRVNGLPTDAVKYLESLQLPPSGLPLVIVKLPKNLALLQDQLIRLQPLLDSGARMLVGGMQKSMPSSVWKSLEQIIGPTSTRPGWKKAKLIEVLADSRRAETPNPFPTRWPLQGTDLIITNHANVFARERLDIGSRFMLQHLPPTEGELDIIDLGCGNGVLGLMAARQNPRASIHFVDESYMAVDSARINFSQLGAETGRASFHCADGLTEFAADSADLVLCNPPFHQQHSVADTIALSMFKQSARVLRSGGELWVIGNRHLGYHNKLRRWFSRVDLVASNAKFVILKAFAN
ncbi:MAG: methyltransferase [Gammaproteobacteria bacterium]|nr:methyltransferase [Gammaproteobacteria bacterium]